MAYHFRNLVFEGGGAKGIAYVGALEVLEARGILENIRRVGGTSAGAIIATLTGLGHSTAEISSILRGLDFTRFMDDDAGILRDSSRFLREFGWFKGDEFRDWIAGIIRGKTGNGDATFNDVRAQAEAKRFRDIYFVGTNLSTGFAEIFSHEHTPRMCVADAVRISGSIPLLFAAKRSPRGDVYADGAVLDNYPVKLFDRQKYVERHSTIPEYYAAHNDALRAQGMAVSPYVYNQETLGFKLASAAEIAVFRDHAEPPRRKVDNLLDYLHALVDTILESQGDRHLHADDWHRTIYIDTLGVRTTEFDLSEEKRAALAASGKSLTEKYFAWYDDPASGASNKPR